MNAVKDTDLPPVLRSLRRSLALAYRAEPRLLVVAFVVLGLSWLPDAFAALWLKRLADGVIDGHDRTVAWASAGLAAAAAGGWVLRTIGQRIENRFRDRATIELEGHVAELQATIAALEHHERPDHLDRLQLLREQVFLLNHLYPSLLSSVSTAGRLLITVALLVSVHPVLVLLAVFAAPTLIVASKRAGAERQATEAAASYRRLTRHLFHLSTTAGSAKELRVNGLAPVLHGRRRQAWDDWFAIESGARRTSALLYAATWTLFGAAYVGAVVFVASGIDAPTGDVLLVLAAGAGLSRYLGATVGEAGFLRWTLDASQRLVWLEDLAAAHRDPDPLPVPDRLRDGIRFDGVGFTYPGSDRPVLQDVDLHLRAGSVVALVGENGAGKSTLVKLLCRFYDPTTGQVTVDGTDLARIPASDWRTRLSGAFQDFFRFEYLARRSIGVGDLERIDDGDAVHAAIGRAGAVDVLERLPAGVDTQLGVTWAGGVELSVGQWQKLALARGFMRERPLVCVLDEPTAALDAETEHALFERFAMFARGGDTPDPGMSREAAADGRITVLVSHRFSTVRMADQIIVLDGTRVAEAGTHDQLVAGAGLYAELYETQAAQYR